MCSTIIAVAYFNTMMINFKIFGVPYTLHIQTLAGSEKVLEKRFDGPGKYWNFLSVKVWEPCCGKGDMTGSILMFIISPLPQQDSHTVGIRMPLNFSGLFLLRYQRPHESDSYILNPVMVKYNF